MQRTDPSSLALPFLLLVMLAGATPTAHSASLASCTSIPDPNPDYLPGLLVNCSELGLDLVPRDLPARTTTLLLSHNNLTVIRNDSFSSLTMLKELDLSTNQISTLHPNAFRGLSRLVRLSLRKNGLAYHPTTYPKDVFAPLVSLRILSISRNNWHLITPQRKLPVLGTDGHTASVRGLENKRLSFRSEKEDAREASSSNTRFHYGGTLNITAGVHGESAKPGEDEGHSLSETSLEWKYPDDALSQLSSLKYLSMDGLINKILGPGFASLSRLTHLDMNGKHGDCRLTPIDNTTFANVAQVTHLNLSNCKIDNLTRDAFSPLQRLEDLDLSWNRALGFDLIGEAFYGLVHTHLKSLTIDSIVPLRNLGTIINATHVRFFRKLRYLERLQARFNRIEALDNGVLCSGIPPNLTYINVDGNLFELAPYLNDLSCLKSLERLDVNGLNALWTPPLMPPDDEDDQERSGCQVMSGLRESPREENAMEVIVGEGAALEAEEKSPLACVEKQFSMPPNMHTLHAKNLGLVYKLLKLRVNSTNTLKKIHVSKNHFPFWIGPLCGFDNVTELHLMNTLAKYVNHEFFPSFPALEVLNISNNDLRNSIRTDEEGKLFQGLKNLRVLDISRNDIGHVTNKSLLPLENLEELYVTVNGMGHFTPIVSHMKKLRHLDLSNNQLQNIPKEIRDHLDMLAESFNVTVNMTFNPIACTCANIDFLIWIRESKVWFGTTYNYYCQGPDGSQKYMDDIFDTIAILQRTCGSYVGVFVGALVCCLSVALVLVMALAYRFRWKLRYLYYITRLGLRRRERLLEEEQHQFHYDAFLSFSSEDSDFVEREMMRRLEEDHGLRLCIHTRDFTPGEFTATLPRVVLV